MTRREFCACYWCLLNVKWCCTNRKEPRRRRGLASPRKRRSCSRCVACAVFFTMLCRRYNISSNINQGQIQKLSVGDDGVWGRVPAGSRDRAIDGRNTFAYLTLNSHAVLHMKVLNTPWSQSRVGRCIPSSPMYPPLTSTFCYVISDELLNTLNTSQRSTNTTSVSSHVEDQGHVSSRQVTSILGQ